MHPPLSAAPFPFSFAAKKQQRSNLAPPAADVGGTRGEAVWHLIKRHMDGSEEEKCGTVQKIKNKKLKLPQLTAELDASQPPQADTLSESHSSDDFMSKRIN